MSTLPLLLLPGALLCALAGPAPAQDLELRETARRIVEERRRRAAQERAEERLAELVAEHRVPGLALVVLDDAGRLASAAAGHADPELARPFTPDTLAPVGALTELWTCVLLGQLVADEELAWSDPVGALLPELAESEGAESEGGAPLLLELAAHTAGYPPLPLLATGDASGTALVEALGRVPREAGPRRLVECPAAFAALGELVARRTGEPWAGALHGRLLGPLRLKHTLASPRRDAGERPEVRGAVWDTAEGRFAAAPHPTPSTEAAARGLRTSAHDFARLLGVLLDRGRWNDERVLPPRLAEILLAPVSAPDERGIRSTRGLRLRTWQGRTLAERTSVGPGHLAHVGWLPEEGAAFVALAGAGEPALLEPLRDLFAELLQLEDEAGEPTGADEAAAPPDGAAEAALEPLPWEDALGPYVGDLVALPAVPAEIARSGRQLLLRLPGGGALRLEPAGDDVLRITEGLPGEIALVRGDGSVAGFTLRAGPYRFEFTRVGWTRYVPALEPYLGAYRSPEGALLGVRAAAGGLVAELPGRGPLLLARGAEPDLWSLPGGGDLRFRFRRGADGAVTALGLLGDPPRELEKVRGAEPRSALELLQPLARGRALDAAGRIRLTGFVRLPDTGLEGRVRAWVEGHGRWRLDLDLGRFGTHRVAVDGETGWIDWDGVVRPLAGEALRAARAAHPLALHGDWRRLHPWLRELPGAALRGVPLQRFRLVAPDLPPLEVTFEPESRRLVRVTGPALAPDGTPVERTTTILETRPFRGLDVPARLLSEDPECGRRELSWETVASDEEPGDPFARPPSATPAEH